MRWPASSSASAWPEIACEPPSPTEPGSPKPIWTRSEHLEADGPLTQRALGERLSITSGAVTMLIDRLEAAGWVRRGPHPTDRRYVLLELTEQAERGAPPGLILFHNRIRSIANDVPVEHREALCAFLVAAAEAASSAAEDLSK